MILVLVRQGNDFDISTVLRGAGGFREPETLTKETPSYNHFIRKIEHLDQMDLRNVDLDDNSFRSSLVCTSLISGFNGNIDSTTLVFLTQDNFFDI